MLGHFESQEEKMLDLEEVMSEGSGGFYPNLLR